MVPVLRQSGESRAAYCESGVIADVLLDSALDKQVIDKDIYGALSKCFGLIYQCFLLSLDFGEFRRKSGGFWPKILRPLPLTLNFKGL